MDANLVYRKTAEGEEAVRQRTRVVQRNTRMVLILVDGKSTVGDLCEKTGNAQLVENALADLERDGLVALQIEQDSLWEQGRKTAEEIKKAAVERLSKDSVKPTAAGEVDAPGAVPASLPPVVSPIPPSISPVPPSAVAEPFSIGPASISPQSSYPAFGGEAPNSAFANPSLPPPDSEPPQPVSAPAADDRAAAGGGFGGFFKRSRDDDSIKPIRTGPRRYVSRPLALAALAGGATLLLLLIFLLYPYDRHRPQLEAAIGGIVGQPVKIAAISASLLPHPSIKLDAVTTGDEGHARAGHIRLIPEIWSLFGAHPAFSRVEVEAGVVDGPMLARLPEALSTMRRHDGDIKVGTLTFSRLRLSVLGLDLAGLQGEFELADAASDGGFAFTSADRAFRLVLKGSGSGGVVGDFEGYGWQPVVDSAYRFDSIQGKLRWDGRQLTVSSLDARIFDAAIAGGLLFERNGQPTLSGDLGFKHMTLPRLAAALGYGVRFDGELSGTLKFTAAATSWDDVLQKATGEGEFAVQRAVAGGFDFVESIRRAGKGPVAGGTTRFEQLNGRLALSPTAMRLYDLTASSGLLRVAGETEVARGGNLTGRFDVEMRGSAASVRRQVTLGGSLKSPELKSAR